MAKRSLIADKNFFFVIVSFFVKNLSCGGALPHTASTGWIKPVLAGLTNHNLCDMFYTLTKMFVYKLLLRVSQNSGHYLFFQAVMFLQPLAVKVESFRVAVFPVGIAEIIKVIDPRQAWN